MKRQRRRVAFKGNFFSLFRLRTWRSAKIIPLTREPHTVRCARILTRPCRRMKKRETRVFPAVLESEKEGIKVEIPIEVIEWPVGVSDYRYDRVHRRPCGADLASDRSESMKGDGPTILLSFEPRFTSLLGVLSLALSCRVVRSVGVTERTGRKILKVGRSCS